MESGQVFICKLTMPKLLTTKTTTLHLTISINAPVNLGLITDQSRQLELFTLVIPRVVDCCSLNGKIIVVLLTGPAPVPAASRIGRNAELPDWLGSVRLASERKWLLTVIFHISHNIALLTIWLLPAGQPFNCTLTRWLYPPRPGGLLLISNIWISIGHQMTNFSENDDYKVVCFNLAKDISTVFAVIKKWN